MDETVIGRQVRALRLQSDLEQAELALRAGISERSLRALETGAGSSLKTLIRTLEALGAGEWLTTLAPAPSSSPRQRALAARGITPRQRVSRRREP